MKLVVHRSRVRRWAPRGLALVLALAWLTRAGVARAGEVEDAVQGLAASSDEKVVEAVSKLAFLGDPRAIGDATNRPSTASNTGESDIAGNGIARLNSAAR